MQKKQATQKVGKPSLPETFPRPRKGTVLGARSSSPRLRENAKQQRPQAERTRGTKAQSPLKFHQPKESNKGCGNKAALPDVCVRALDSQNED